jgi:hypothetical protein
VMDEATPPPVLALLDELTACLRTENELLGRMALREVEAHATAKARLLELYEREIAGLRTDPDRFRRLPDEVREQLRLALREFQSVAAANLALVTGSRGIVEKLVRRLAIALGHGGVSASGGDAAMRPLALNRTI